MAQTLTAHVGKMVRMWLFLVCLVAAAVWVITSEVRLRSRVTRRDNLGWMSERWLAEYRASHSG